MSWLIAAYLVVALAIALYVMRIRRLRKGLPPWTDAQPPRK